MTVLEAAEEVAPDAWRTRIRSLLGSFLFTGGDVYKTCGVLSGGERQRVALARILLTPSNLILLDEPTHHLDLAGKQVLEEALEQYPGAVVVVTHDRSLMARLATRVIEVNAGRAVLYPGGYDDYEAARLARKVEAESAALPVREPVSAKSSSTDRPASGNRKAGGEKADRKSAPRGGSGSAARKTEMTRLEKEIEARETRLSVVETEMANPLTYTDGNRVRKLVAEQKGLRAELEKLWQQLADL
jgi:ATP-binding cassette subfamily F protein 3